MPDILAPIVLFVYNRPWHTQQTIEALQQNALAAESELFIYCDAAKTDDAQQAVDEVRTLVKSITGFKTITIIERESNWGLANSIIDGVTTVVNQFGKIIVMEDDLVTSPYFLTFMNESLIYYNNTNNIMSISGYSYGIEQSLDSCQEVFLFYRSCSWGWAIWREKWDLVDFTLLKDDLIFTDKRLQRHFNKGGDDLFEMLTMQLEGKIDSWGIRYAYQHAKHGQYTLYPAMSLVQNIGHDNSGTHCGESTKWEVTLNTNTNVKLTKVNIDYKVIHAIQKKLNKTFTEKVIQWFLRSKLKQLVRCSIHRYRNLQQPN